MSSLIYELCILIGMARGRWLRRGSGSWGSGSRSSSSRGGGRHTADPSMEDRTPPVDASVDDQAPTAPLGDDTDPAPPGSDDIDGPQGSRQPRGPNRPHAPRTDVLPSTIFHPVRGGKIQII